MTALAILVQTMALARILLMDTTAAVQQVLLENSAIKVSLLNMPVNQRIPRIRVFKIYNNIYNIISFQGNKYLCVCFYVQI